MPKSRARRSQACSKKSRIAIYVAIGLAIAGATISMTGWFIHTPMWLRAVAGGATLVSVLWLLWKGADGGNDNGPYAGHRGGMWGIRSA